MLFECGEAALFELWQLQEKAAARAKRHLVSCRCRKIKGAFETFADSHCDMVSIDRPGNQTIRILHKHDVPELLCQPKINDAHDLIRGQAEVRQFYVAVQKVLGMHLLNPAK